MRMIILAQAPPPIHGQSVMVQTLLDGLPAAAPDLPFHHVNLPLSRDAASIGRWKLEKYLTLRRAVAETIERQRHTQADTLYYVPAPGKTISALRDILLLQPLRPHFKRLVLHWHAAGLGEWAERRRVWNRMLQSALGGASLSLVTSKALSSDAIHFSPQCVQVVPNGITDPVVFADRRTGARDFSCRFLYLGLIHEEKGVFHLIDAFKKALASSSGEWTLRVAGEFASPQVQSRFVKACATLKGRVQWVGFAQGQGKQDLLASSDVVCLPTIYPHEAQPLVALEALAADRRIVAARWRALPETLEGSLHWLHEPGDVDSLAKALSEAALSAPPEGRNRNVFLQRFTREQHLLALASALRQIPG